jgi:hypothetical protein
MKEIHILDVVANYNNKKIQVTIKRKKKEFELQELYALHSENNKKRLAKSGEILYLIDHKSITDDVKKVKYGLKITPKLNKDFISKNDIEWSFNGENQYFSTARTNITRSLEESENTITTTVTAGVSTKLEKSVDVKWVDEGYSKYSFSLGSDAHPLIKKVFEATKMIDGVTSFLDRIPFFKRAQENEVQSNKIAWYFNVIPFEQTLLNKEDKTSRLYYKEKKTRGGFNLGLKGELKYTVWGIPYDKLEKLPIPDWAINKAKEFIVAEVNLVLKANSKGEVMAETIERKFIESNEWLDHKKQINPAALSFKLSGGVEGNFSLLKDNKWFGISGTASGLVNTEVISVGWRENEFGIYPLREGVNLDLRASAYIRFLGKKLETETFYERIEIIAPF